MGPSINRRLRGFLHVLLYMFGLDYSGRLRVALDIFGPSGGGGGSIGVSIWVTHAIVAITIIKYLLRNATMPFSSPGSAWSPHLFV